jgi:hypothetical protein
LGWNLRKYSNLLTSKLRNILAFLFRTGVGIKWDEAPLKDGRREMDRLWDSFFEGRRGRKVEEVGEWFPSLDVSETK